MSKLQKIYSIPKMGDSGDDVLTLKAALIVHGSAFTFTNDYFGPSTLHQVRLFQKANNLPGSGRIGEKTLALLDLEYAQDPEIDISYSPSDILNKRLLIRAASQIGIKEGAGSKENPQVQEYLAFGTKSNTQHFPDSVAWCSGFQCWTHEKEGDESTDNLMARSWEKWGVDSKSDPLPGDTVTQYRGDKAAGLGHVYMFLKKVGNTIYGLGGNQSDMVNVAQFGTSHLTSIRRSKHAPTYTPEQRAELVKIADAIIAGKKIDNSGAVT